MVSEKPQLHIEVFLCQPPGRICRVTSSLPHVWYWKRWEAFVGTYLPEALISPYCFLYVNMNNTQPNGFRSTRINTIYLCAFQITSSTMSWGQMYKQCLCTKVIHTSPPTVFIIFIIKTMWWEGVHLAHTSKQHRHGFLKECDMVKQKWKSVGLNTYWFIKHVEECKYIFLNLYEHRAFVFHLHRIVLHLTPHILKCSLSLQCVSKLWKYPSISCYWDSNLRKLFFVCHIFITLICLLRTLSHICGSYTALYI